MSAVNADMGGDKDDAAKNEEAKNEDTHVFPVLIQGIDYGLCPRLMETSTSQFAWRH